MHAYDERLDRIPRVVVVTKADLDEETAQGRAQALASHRGHGVAAISAEAGIGVEALLAELMTLVREEREKAATQDSEEIVIIRPAGRERYSVTESGPNEFRVEGRQVVTFVEMMDTTMEGAKDEVLRRLERWGVGKALRKAGVVPGDRITFGETVIEWEE